jgi:serine protease Do
VKIKKGVNYMLKKSIIISLLASFTLANTINFNQIEKNPNRLEPSNSNTIVSYSKTIKGIKNSVVNISTKTKVKNQGYNQLQHMFKNPFFEQFFGREFGNNIPKERIQRSLGSGVILSKDGYIVTNAHVVEGADEIVVSIGVDKKEYNAKLIGSDKDSDLAVIKIEGKDFQAISIGSSEYLEVGDLVFAVGNPFGVGQTVTQGIISALNKDKVGINRYEDFIQTDASINPGNSGGALVDSRGALIGINSAILSKAGGNNGIGFAIPVSMVKNIVTKLVEDGEVQRGYLGVSIRNLSKDLEELYVHKKGALILDVSPDSAASKYGLKRGDLIYKVDDKNIEDFSEFMKTIGSYKPNEYVNLKIERNKKNLSIKVKLGSREEIASNSKDTKILDGLSVEDTKDNVGVVITEVKPDSKASENGFAQGDIIIQIENIEINTLEDLKKAVKKYENTQKRVYINRNGRILVSVIK